MYNQNRCIYCYYGLGETKEHIIPQSFLKRYRYYLQDYDCEIISPENNVAPCCRMCNNSKGSEIKLPTIPNIHNTFKNTPLKYIVGIADWCVEYYDKLCTIADIKYYNTVISYYAYPNLKYELNQVKLLYDSGYYDFLVSLYGINNCVDCLY